MGLVTLCLPVHGGWANEFFDDGKAELGACLPSRPNTRVHFSIGQGQPEPQDNFLIWRSQPVYSGLLGQQTERQLSVPSDCCRRGAVFLVVLFLCVTNSKQTVCVMFGCKADKPNHEQVFPMSFGLFLTQFVFWNDWCHYSVFLIPLKTLKCLYFSQENIK